MVVKVEKVVKVYRLLYPPKRNSTVICKNVVVARIGNTVVPIHDRDVAELLNFVSCYAFSDTYYPSSFHDTPKLSLKRGLDQNGRNADKMSPTQIYNMNMEGLV